MKHLTQGGHKLEAIQLTGDDSVEVMEAAWGIDFIDKSEYPVNSPGLVIYRRSGKLLVKRGEWVLKTAGGKFFKSKDLTELPYVEEPKTKEVA